MLSGERPAIAVLNPAAHLGGAELSLLELIRRCNGRFRFHLLVPEQGRLAREAAAAGATVWRLPWPARLQQAGERAARAGAAPAALAGLPGFVRQLQRLLGETGCEVLITNGIKAHVAGALCPRGRRVLLWYFREALEGRPLSTMLLRALARRCTAVVAISRYVAGQSRRAVPPGVPVHVLYNAVDLDRFRPGLQPASDLAKPPGETWFGVAGALTPLKGQDLFLRAAEMVLRALPEARFLVAGSNFYRTDGEGPAFERELRAFVDASTLRGRVSFLGFREEMPAVLAALDVLVQPNRGPEGLGRSVLEAMACGVPVVAVDRWGPAEVVQDGRSGLLFRWMDAAHLADRMILAGSQPALRARLAARARQWAEANLDPNVMAAAFARIVESAAPGGRPQ
jgi:glycosyltransferase involved in cell wall biosynthesis